MEGQVLKKNILRFAPSPTGYLHLGNVRTAIFNFLLAKKNNGEFILRLDDTDQERSNQHYIDQIKYDLEWLGICWDRVEQQSKRLDRYKDILNCLIKNGNVYECFETTIELDLKRKKQLNSGQPPIYDRQSLKLSDRDKTELRKKVSSYFRFHLSGNKVTWKDKIAGDVEVQTNVVSDPILIKANGQFLYTIASVIDDIDFKISEVVRGVDHLTNTAVQIEIFKTLVGSNPEFAHHSLIVNSSGENFSKRANSLSIKELREKGVEPGAIFSILVNLGNGKRMEIKNDLPDFAKDFDLKAFNTSPTKFNTDDLYALSRVALSKLDIVDISAFMSEIGIPGEKQENFWDMARDNVQKRSELNSLWNLCQKGTTPLMLSEDKDFIRLAISLLPEHPRDEKSWKLWTDKVKETTGRSGKDLYMPLRMYLTGSKKGPDMHKLFPFLEKAKKL